MITGCKRADTGSCCLDDSRTFVPKDDREGMRQDAARIEVVRVTSACCRKADEYLAVPGSLYIESPKLKGRSDCLEDRGY
jgi:hypothetical protein